MQYKYFSDRNYEDFSCGRVICQKSGFTNYPVRLAGEIFMRCLKLSGNINNKVCIYDPCCGGAYLLTVLGFLCRENIKSIYASDISPEAVSLARDNLNLLTHEGLENRKNHLISMYDEFYKNSHFEAIQSAERLNNFIKPGIGLYTFIADALDPGSLQNTSFTADIVITDVPYGRMVSWSGIKSSSTNTLLNNLFPILKSTSVAAVSSDKDQKISDPLFKRLDKIQVGKRKIEFFRKV